MRCVLTLLMLLLVVGGSQQADSMPRELSLDPYDPAQIHGWTLEQQVGQLLIWGSTQQPSDLTPILEGAAIAAPIPIGGVLLTSKKERLAESVRVLAQFLRTTPTTPVPPFLCADQEGGLVAALRDQVRVAPSHQVLGAESRDTIYQAALAMGKDTQAAGIDMILGPVFDVDSAPLNPVIGGKERSFGGDPVLVAEAGLAFVAGLQEAGLVAVPKHFPGHGTVLADSHLVLPTTSQSRADWLATEEVPYARLASERRRTRDSRPLGVMVAHVDWPALTDGEGPSCFSRTLVTNTLRRDYLQPQDVIISDDLLMKAIDDPLLGAVAMRRAGIDLIIVSGRPATLRAVHHTLVKFYRNGWLDKGELEASLVRILGMKRWMAEQWSPLESDSGRATL